MNTFDTVNKFIADLSRPLSIFMLCFGLCAAIFIPTANIAAASLAAGVATALIGARSFENHAIIKSEGEIKKANGNGNGGTNGH